jgi:hypothetical protein
LSDSEDAAVAMLQVWKARFVFRRVENCVDMYRVGGTLKYSRDILVKQEKEVFINIRPVCGVLGGVVAVAFSMTRCRAKSYESALLSRGTHILYT